MDPRSKLERRLQYGASLRNSSRSTASPRTLSDQNSARLRPVSARSTYGTRSSFGDHGHDMRTDPTGITRSKTSLGVHGTYPSYTTDTRAHLTHGDDSGINYGSSYMDTRTDYRSPEYDSYNRRVQAQRQTFRSAQASKQMVLEVYGNCITMLEELESREMRRRGERSLPRSDIYLPSQGHYDDSTIERKLDTQLLLLQSQLQSCDSEIKGDVREEMEEGTLRWMSGRNDRRVRHGLTDKYAGKLFEVIHKGKIKHPDVFYKSPSIGERDMQHAMGAFVAGSHRRSQLDDDFRRDPGRMAGTPMLRAGSGVAQGAERLLDVRPDLYTGVQRHWNGNLC